MSRSSRPSRASRSSCEGALVRRHGPAGPERAFEGTLDLEGALVLDGVDDDVRLREAHAAGNAGRRRAATPEAVKAALARPEVASVLVPTEELLALDLTELTYG